MPRVKRPRMSRIVGDVGGDGGVVAVGAGSSTGDIVNSELLLSSSVVRSVEDKTAIEEESDPVIKRKLGLKLPMKCPPKIVKLIKEKSTSRLLPFWMTRLMVRFLFHLRNGLLLGIFSVLSI